MQSDKAQIILLSRETITSSELIDLTTSYVIVYQFVGVTPETPPYMTAKTWN